MYERALEERGLPTVSASGGGFWSRLEVLDLVAYLALVANPLDEHALYSVLASPLVGASSDALALVATTAQDLERSAWWTLQEAFGGDGAAGLAERLTGSDRVVLEAFTHRMGEERPRAPRLSLATLLARAMSAADYEQGLRAAPGGPRRVRNVEKLLHLARGYEEEHGRDLRGFLDFVAARTRTPGTETESPLPEGEEAAIRVMTIHAAKGLEFDVVCVADLGRAPALSTPDLLVDGGRVGVRVVVLDGRSSVPALAYDELREARLEADAAEEDRDPVRRADARAGAAAAQRSRGLRALAGSKPHGRPDQLGGDPRWCPACPIGWTSPSPCSTSRRRSAGTPRWFAAV